MATTIKIKRGLKTNLPTLAVGELGYCTDTNELFIGTSEGNVLVNEGTQKVGQPVITEVDNTVGNEYVFTLTNNNPYTVNIRYELGTTPPSANEITLTEGETSSNITLSVDAETSYTLYAQSVVREEYVEEFFDDSEITSATFTTPEIPPIVLGVEWDRDTDSYTRLDNAVGLTSGSDFDNINIISGINPYRLRRCMVNDDLSINYYIDPNDPTKIGEVVNTGSYTTGGTANYTGSHGQVMVEIPKFWWKYDEPTSKQYQWRITNQAQSGYDVHPAFITNGVTKNYIYMGAFEASVDGTEAKSVSNINPRNNITIGLFRTYAQSRGTGWQQQTYWGRHALQLLYLIEYADFNSQSNIGTGGSGSSELTTGLTISLGNSSGSSGSAISYRGVENVWGSLGQWVDGLHIFSGAAYISNENFGSINDYTLVGNISPTFGFKFYQDILFPHFLPTQAGGSSSSFVTDQYGYFGGDRIASSGGGYPDGTTNIGLFYWVLDRTIGAQGNQYGARLQIL